MDTKELLKYSYLGIRENHCSSGSRVVHFKEELSGVPTKDLMRLACFNKKQGINPVDSIFLFAYVMSRKDYFITEDDFNGVIESFWDLRLLTKYILWDGIVNRNSFGRTVKRYAQKFLNSRDEDDFYYSSFYQAVKVKELLRFFHPRPINQDRQNLFHNCIKNKGRFKSKGKFNPQEFIQVADWESIYDKTLNLYNKHKIMDYGLLPTIEKRLSDSSLLINSGVRPYKLLKKYNRLPVIFPGSIKEICLKQLEVAMEPKVQTDKNIFLFIENSLSMLSPVYINKESGKTIKGVDLGCIFYTIISRANKNTFTLFFDSKPRQIQISPRDTFLRNLKTIGGWIRSPEIDFKAPLQLLNAAHQEGDYIIYLAPGNGYKTYLEAGGLFDEWAIFKARNPQAKLIFIDFMATGDLKSDQDSVLTCSGLNDNIVESILRFIEGKFEGIAQSFLRKINSVNLANRSKT